MPGTYDLGSSAGIEIPMSDIDDYEIYVRIQQKSETS